MTNGSGLPEAEGVPGMWHLELVQFLAYWDKLAESLTSLNNPFHVPIQFSSPFHTFTPFLSPTLFLSLQSRRDHQATALKIENIESGLTKVLSLTKLTQATLRSFSTRS